MACCSLSVRPPHPQSCTPLGPAPLALHLPVMTSARRNRWAALGGLCILCPPAAPADPLRQEMGGPAAALLEVGSGGLPSSSISPLGSARRRVWAPGPSYTYSLLLSLSPCLFVTESGGPVAGGGSFGGGGPALPPSFCPSLWLLVWSSSTPSPLVPWKLALHSSCPCLLLPGNSHPFQSQGRGGRGEDGQVNGVWGSVHAPPRIHRTKPRIPLSSPVLFLLQPQSLQVSGLQGPGER